MRDSNIYNYIEINLGVNENKLVFGVAWTTELCKTLKCSEFEKPFQLNKPNFGNGKGFKLFWNTTGYKYRQ